MKTLPLDSLLVCALASWRYAYFVIGDVLSQPTKNRILDRYENWAFNKRRTRTEKKIDALRMEQASFQELLDYADKRRHSKDADKYEELVQDIEEEIRAIKPKRSFNQNLWIKLTILLSCIYCLTFWTAIFTYNVSIWVANIGAIWGLATLIGLMHDKYFTEPESSNGKVE